jgi:hypothetical protein
LKAELGKPDDSSDRVTSKHQRESDNQHDSTDCHGTGINGPRSN